MRLIGVLQDSLLYVRENDKDYKILFSNDGGKTFLPSKMDLTLSLEKGPNNIFVSCQDSRKCMVSTNRGRNWKKYSTNQRFSNPTINCIAVNKAGHIFLGNQGGGVICSTDSGKTWTNIGLKGYQITALSIDGNNTLFAAANKPTWSIWDPVDRGIFSFRNSDSTWVHRCSTDTYIHDLLSIGKDSLFVATDGRGIFILQTKLNSFKQLISGFEFTNNNKLTIDKNDNIFLTTYSYGAFRSTDSGDHWEQLNYGLNDNYTEQISIGYPSKIFIACWNGGIFDSYDLGDNWGPTKGRPEGISTGIVSRNDSILFVGTNSSGVFKSLDGGANWQSCNLDGCEIRDLYLLPVNQLLAGSYGITEYYAREIVETDSGRGVFYSPDDGLNWILLGLKMQKITVISVDRNNIVYAGSDSALFISRDFGKNWKGINLDKDNVCITTIYCDSSGYVFAGSENKGIFFSGDNGNSWFPLNKGLTSLYIRDIKGNSKGEIFVATSDKGVFKGNIKNLIK